MSDQPFVVDQPLEIPDGWWVVWCDGCGASYTFDDDAYASYGDIQPVLAEAQSEHVREDHEVR